MSDQLLVQERLRAQLRRLGIDPGLLDLHHSHLNVVNITPDEPAVFHWEGKHYRIPLLVLEQAVLAATKEDFFAIVKPVWTEMPDRAAK